MMQSRSLAAAAVLAALFFIGSVLMGFEMLGSRYLNPYFGSGVTTWACLISVVLLAMMVGYYGGGYVADRWQRLDLWALTCIAAGLSMALVPPSADAILSFLVATLGDGFWGISIGAMGISFVPVALLSACSPFVVRLLLTDLAMGGRTTGLVYSISTFGNVAGTLLTTFVLIPSFGVRDITTGFSLALCLLGGTIFLLRGPLTRQLQAAAIGLIGFMILGILPGWVTPSRAGDDARTVSASYPEGPLWKGNVLYYTEMGADRVMRLGATAPEIFWRAQGCGPTAIAPLGDHDFVILCHLGRKLVVVNEAGALVRQISQTPSGRLFQDPNDVTSDGDGGAFFTDAGLFYSGAPATGIIYHLRRGGDIDEVARDVKYANGIAYDPAARELVFSEHLARRVWSLMLSPEGTVIKKTLLADFSNALIRWKCMYPEAGPDGIEFDGQNLLIALYGAGKVVILSRDGSFWPINVPMQYVTNISISESHVAIVGAFNNSTAPYEGAVLVWPKVQLSKEMGGHEN